MLFTRVETNTLFFNVTKESRIDWNKKRRENIANSIHHNSKSRDWVMTQWFVSNLKLGDLMTQWFVIYNTAPYDSPLQPCIVGITNSHSINDVCAIMSFYNISDKNEYMTNIYRVFFFFLSNKRKERNNKTKPFIYIFHEFYIFQNRFSRIR